MTIASTKGCTLERKKLRFFKKKMKARDNGLINWFLTGKIIYMKYISM